MAQTLRLHERQIDNLHGGDGPEDSSSVRGREEEGSDFVIDARTEARSLEGFEKTIKRGVAYVNAGANYVYVECPQSLQEVGKLVKEIQIWDVLDEAPLAFNLILGGKTHCLP